MRPEDVDPKALLERAKLLVKEACGEGHDYRIDLEGDGKNTDYTIVIDLGIGIYWSDETVIEKVQGFQVQKIHYDPGVMYYPDGSGQPPDTDYEDIGELHDRFDYAFIEAFMIAVEARLDDVAEEYGH